jgi:hypothetical protein
VNSTRIYCRLAGCFIDWYMIVKYCGLFGLDFLGARLSHFTRSLRSFVTLKKKKQMCRHPTTEVFSVKIKPTRKNILFLPYFKFYYVFYVYKFLKMFFYPNLHDNASEWSLNFFRYLIFLHSLPICTTVLKYFLNSYLRLNTGVPEMRGKILTTSY